MRFVDFRLRGFAQHRDTTLTFATGTPSLIVGPNESGKSQLLTGLIGTIFGLPDCVPFQPWAGDPVMEGELRLEVDGRDIRICRSFAGGGVTVSRDGEALYQGRGFTFRRGAEDERYQILLADWFGVSDMDLFRSLVFIEQDQLADQRVAQRSAEIKQLISGSREVSYETAIKDLDDNLDKLKRRGRARNDREIEILAAEIAELERRVGKAADAEAEAIALEEEEARLSTELDDLRERQKQLGALIDLYGEHRRMKLDVERQSSQVSLLRRDLHDGESISARREQLESEIASLRVPGDPDPDAVRRLVFEQEQALKDKDESERALAELERDGRLQQPASLPIRARETGPSFGLLVAAAVIALASLVSGIELNPLGFTGLLLAVIVASVAVRPRSSGRANPGATDPARAQIMDRQRAKLVENRQRIDERLHALDQQGALWLASSGEPDLDRLLARLDQYETGSIRLSELKHVQPEELARRRDEYETALTQAAIATRRLQQLEQEHPQLLELDSERLAEHQRTLRRQEAGAGGIEQRLNEIKVRRGVLRSTTADDAAALRILAEEKRGELANKQRLAQALDLAVQTLRRCVHDFQEHALDPVAAQAGLLTQEITSGRYARIDIDQQTMAPSVHIPGHGSIPAEQLSRGSQDQVYLAIRIGLVDALSGTENLPIIFDDPCVHFDAARLQATVQLLSEIARERQVVVLTKDEGYARWFEPVLRLERDEFLAAAATQRSSDDRRPNVTM